jgi:hypothetical protein
MGMKQGSSRLQYLNVSIRTSLITCLVYITCYWNIHCNETSRPWAACSRITSIKSPSFCMTTPSAILTHLTVFQPQSRDYSCYVSRPILAPPPLWMHKHTNLRTHDFAHCNDLRLQPKLPSVACAWSWELCGINPAIHNRSSPTPSYNYEWRYFQISTGVKNNYCLLSAARHPVWSSVLTKA